MKLKLITLLLSAVSVVSVGANANSFQYQTDADYLSADNKGVDASLWQIKQQFLLKPVSTSAQGPWAEAVFMGRVSSGNVSFSRATVDINMPGYDEKYHANAWSVGGEYMDKNHNFYAALDWNMINNSRAYEAAGKLGYFVQQNWLVSADLFHVKEDDGRTHMDYGVSTKVIIPVMGGDFLVLNAALRDYKDHSNSLSLEADYYLRPYWSVGLTYADDAIGMDEKSQDSYGIRSQYFVTPQLAFRGGMTRVDVAGASDENVYNIGASYRF